MSDPRFAGVRREYESPGLDRAHLDPDPFAQFDRWFQDAVDSGIEEPNAFVLATADPAGRPSARAVLMKGIDHAGLVFFTNYLSRKGGELAENPQGAAVFVWIPLHRQIRLEGGVEQIESAASDAYFVTRPAEARAASTVSPQSRVVTDKQELEQAFDDIMKAHPEGDVPRPGHWGGYRLKPTMFEFWQGQPHRFHDRFRYRHEGDGWHIERLAP
jgi:pyridoxamine 5'-phosphate oxidase